MRTCCRPPRRAARSRKRSARNSPATARRRSRWSCPRHAGSGASVDALALARAARQPPGQASEAVPPRYLGRGTWEIELLPRGSDASVGQPAAGPPPAHARAPGRSAGRRHDRLVHRPEGRDLRAHAAGAGDPRVRHARHAVPDDRLGRAAADGAADEPAHGRRRRRAARADLPGRAPLLADGLQPDRRPGGVEPRAAVHGRVRAVDRLRGVPVRAHQRGPRRRPLPRATRSRTAWSAPGG